MKSKIPLVLLVILIVVSLGNLTHNALAFMSQNTNYLSSNSSHTLITTRVLVVFAGIDNDVIQQLGLKRSYTLNLTSKSTLKIFLDERVLSQETYNNITGFIDENSKHMNLSVFMEKYIEIHHPEWDISSGCYVRADIMEQYLYSIVNDVYNASNYDYVLLLLYYPQDHCLRTYYIEKYFWEIHSTRNYTGLVAFGGNTPLFFIDFSSIPITHPDKTQPLYGYGEPVDIYTFKPLWDIGSNAEKAAMLRKYILDYLGFLVLRKLFDDRLHWSPQYIIDIRVIDYTNGSGYDRVIRVLNTSKLYLYLRSLTPYTTWKIDVSRTYANDSNLLMTLLENSTGRIEDNKTWIILDYINTISLISGHYPVITSRDNETIIPVYVFVANKPIHFEFNKQINFTGAAVPGVSIIVSYPGYYYRILEEGMSMVVAHEIGHLLGLTHPFEGYDPLTGNETIIWLYDYITSPMSYAPTLAGWLGGKFIFDSRSLCRYHALDLISMLSGKAGYKAIVDEALRLLSVDKCLGEKGALSILREAYLGKHLTPSNATTTATETTATPETCTMTISLVKTMTKTKTVTTTATASTEKTITITSDKILTHTVVERENITVTTTIFSEKTPTWITHLLETLIALSIIAIIIAVAIITRR